MITFHCYFHSIPFDVLVKNRSCTWYLRLNRVLFFVLNGVIDLNFIIAMIIQERETTNHSRIDEHFAFYTRITYSLQVCYRFDHTYSHHYTHNHES